MQQASHFLCGGVRASCGGRHRLRFGTTACDPKRAGGFDGGGPGRPDVISRGGVLALGIPRRSAAPPQPRPDRDRGRFDSLERRHGAPARSRAGGEGLSRRSRAGAELTFDVACYDYGAIPPARRCGPTTTRSARRNISKPSASADPQPRIALDQVEIVIAPRGPPYCDSQSLYCGSSVESAAKEEGCGLAGSGTGSASAPRSANRRKAGAAPGMTPPLGRGRTRWGQARPRFLPERKVGRRPIRRPPPPVAAGVGVFPARFPLSARPPSAISPDQRASPGDPVAAPGCLCVAAGSGPSKSLRAQKNVRE